VANKAVKKFTVTYKEWQRRRYGDAMYGSRTVFIDGIEVGTWEDWLSCWLADKHRMECGDFTNLKLKETDECTVTTTKSGTAGTSCS
jgi:hypothetical protein